MIIVTGGAGFIGSNIVYALNKMNRANILVVDNLSFGKKFKNLAKLEIQDYIDKDDLFSFLEKGNHEPIEAIFHEGACSVTTEWDGRYMLKNNYEYSKNLLHFALEKDIPFIYASSAAVYGKSKNFQIIKENEIPLNIYGYSKLLFDNYVRKILIDKKPKNQIIGLRYFNVYGPNEEHKGKMASVMFHLQNQLKSTGKIKLFTGSEGYGPGEQLRDFIYVDDVVAVNLWLWQNKSPSGIYNVGTGKSRSFNDVARNILAQKKDGSLEYIPFPEELLEAYQSFTEADLTLLYKIGYNNPFIDLETGIKKYLDWLN